MKTALLIVDLQNALCTGPWAAHGIDALLDRVNALATRARAAGAPVVLIQHEESEGPLVADTAGWQLDERLQTAPGDLRVRKTACDAFHRTPLLELLQADQVERVVVAGLQSEFCIDSTVRGALARGLPAVLVADGHSTVDNGVLDAEQIRAHHNATLANLGSFGPTVRVQAAQDVRFD